VGSGTGTRCCCGSNGGFGHSGDPARLRDRVLGGRRRGDLVGMQEPHAAARGDRLAHWASLLTSHSWPAAPTQVSGRPEWVLAMASSTTPRLTVFPVIRCQPTPARTTWPRSRSRAGVGVGVSRGLGFGASSAAVLASRRS